MHFEHFGQTHLSSLSKVLSMKQGISYMKWPQGILIYHIKREVKRAHIFDKKGDIPTVRYES